MTDMNKKCIFHSYTVSENNGNLNFPNKFLFGFLPFSVTTLLQLGLHENHTKNYAKLRD